ncbi:MAG: GGDEF domain-containing protein [Desulfovibrionaceae bacterium]|nr:GGDEF domain-containing protein [Desulfovibrionaceae bacterium]
MDQDKLPDGALAAPLLSRMDLVGLEAVICAGLREIFPFSAHSFYFPRPALAGETPADTAEYLARERKLLLPLRQPGGEFLGFFVARLPRGVKIRPLLPALPALAGLCLDKAALFRQTLRDPITGLHHRQALLTAVAAELERLSRIIASSERSSLRPTAPWLEYELKNSSGRSAGEFSLLIFRLDGLDELARRHGHLRVEELLAMLGRTLEKLQPGQGFSARSGEDELALLLPGEGPLAGRELGLRLAEKLAGIENRDALTGRICRARISLGQTRVPLDLRGLEGLSPAEQARRLLRRGRLAADLAADSALPALAYADILHEGGRVLESRPFSRVLISLGSEAGAKPGQGFTVWEADGDRHPVYKADLLLLATEENNSLAEVLHLDDPASPPCPETACAWPARSKTTPGMFSQRISCATGAANAKNARLQPWCWGVSSRSSHPRRLCRIRRTPWSRIARPGPRKTFWDGRRTDAGKCSARICSWGVTP